MEDIDDYIEYDEMMQCTKQNNAGGYEIIRGAVGVQTTDSRLLELPTLKMGFAP